MVRAFIPVIVGSIVAALIMAVLLLDAAAPR